jgi:tetratricopeptide (TPR) repeat protein
MEMTLTLEAIGNAYYEQNKLDEAFKYYSDALSMAQNAYNQSRIAINLMNIGNVYSDSGNYKKALDFQFRALEIFKSIDDKS